MIGKTGLAVIILCLWVFPIMAAETTEDAYESQVRTIAKDLRCAVCQNQSVYESNSDLAKDMLNIIRDQIRAGRSEAEVRQYFLDRYGDYIYLEPRRTGMNWIIWGGPFIALAIGFWALVSAIKKWTRKEQPLASAKIDDQDDEMRARIAKELKRIEL